MVPAAYVFTACTVRHHAWQPREAPSTIALRHGHAALGADYSSNAGSRSQDASTGTAMTFWETQPGKMLPVCPA